MREVSTLITFGELLCSVEVRAQHKHQEAMGHEHIISKHKLWECAAAAEMVGKHKGHHGDVKLSSKASRKTGGVQSLAWRLNQFYFKVLITCKKTTSFCDKDTSAPALFDAGIRIQCACD